ncbi:hypothetical protein FC824_05555 [Clostridium sporogenes]|uniref:hypothetical protein n=1 Tax=Clostridium sporogenes TaxID=1509 RepID=UPI0013D6CCF9|nr:hypothetical protein [Clostridium sporogenes]NFG95998.1 hypothetical protein [Clostridium sporogenes]
MKVYVLEYDLEIVKAYSPSETEHRKESYLDMIYFIDAVKRNQDKWYISNMKAYVGEAKEIDIKKVLNPF